MVIEMLGWIKKTGVPAHCDCCMHSDRYERGDGVNSFFLFEAWVDEENGKILCNHCFCRLLDSLEED